MKRPALLSISLTLLILAAGAGGSYAVYDYFHSLKVEAVSSLGKVEEKTAQPPEEAETKDLKTIIHQSQKSVVQLEVESEAGESIGSGFLYNDKGDVVTNAHVVKGAEKIIVRTADAQQYGGYLIGMGDSIDIAVVRVPDLAERQALPIADNETADIGDEVVALGSPLGLQNTVTTGIISGVNREFTIDNYTYTNVYQISAPITKGNSGGPLIDKSSGKVIAINSAGTEEGSIGFSLPISDVFEQLLSWSENPSDKPSDMVTDVEESPRHGTDILQPEDAEYLVGYFYENLAMRDYVTAYSLLGSDWQTSTSYERFREGYIHTVDVTIDQISSKKDGEEVSVTVFVQALEREENQQTNTVLYKCTYRVAYENNQLKMISGSAEEIES